MLVNASKKYGQHPEASCKKLVSMFPCQRLVDRSVDWGLARDEHRYVSIRGETAHKRRAWDIKRIESLLEGGTGGGEPGLAVVRAAAEQ